MSGALVGTCVARRIAPLLQPFPNGTSRTAVASVAVSMPGGPALAANAGPPGIETATDATAVREVPFGKGCSSGAIRRATHVPTRAPDIAVQGRVPEGWG